MKLVALVLICACQKDTGTVAIGSGSDPLPPGPGHFDVSLPKAVHGDEVVSTLRVAVSKSTVYVNGDYALTLSSSAGDMDTHVIARRLAEKLPAPSSPSTKVIIAADKHVEYGVVIEVIDGVKQRGYSAIALESVP